MGRLDALDRKYMVGNRAVMRAFFFLFFFCLVRTKHAVTHCMRKLRGLVGKEWRSEERPVGGVSMWCRGRYRAEGMATCKGEGGHRISLVTYLAHLDDKIG